MRRLPVFSLFVTVAIVLMVCASVIQQSRILSTLKQSSGFFIDSLDENGGNVVPVGNLTLRVASSVQPVYPQLPTQKSKVRRESRNNTNQRQNVKPKRTSSVTRGPPTSPTTNSTRQIMYIHIGKTGGYTLDTVFRSNCAWYGLEEPRSECWKNFNNQNTTTDSVLSHLTKATVHLAPRHHYDRWINDTTTFLFSIRNPIERAVSAFDMDHNQNNNLTDKPNLKRSRAPFYNCFPTAEHLAQELFVKNATDDMNNTANKRSPPRRKIDCHSLGWNVLTGKRTANLVTHLNFNYQSYMNFTLDKFPDKEVMVVRTEYLWEDIAKLDVFLGGTGEFQKAGHQFDHGRSTYVVKSKLTTEGKQNFCKALQDELAVYRMLIERAVNLDATEKGETLDALRKDCGGDALIDR
jgi:hypothetical protein